MKRGINYVWPEKPTFISSYACKTIPLFGSPKTTNILIAPIWNLAPLPEQATVTIFSWTLVLVLYILLKYVAPISFINSVDGQYIDNDRIYISTFILYYLLSAFLVGANVEKACQALEEQASAYLYDAGPPIPATLQSSAY